MAFSRSVVAVCFWIAFAVSAHAQASNPVINRANVPPGYATPTGGTFSIRFPIPFIDMAQTGDNFGTDPDMVVHMVTGKTAAGIRLSASEIPDPKGQLASAETFMDNLNAGSAPAPHCPTCHTTARTIWRSLLSHLPHISWAFICA